ncbi:terpene synthase family protein [Streptomyces aidingensis]|uniref:Terpene synthase n=1 Tax=Streptomyces aidingensis TaxID=910347 RepID=A0A1I1IX82_9ACTN|nr:terpene synthase family protein [Streptomyces aidingensis]SFC40856.1 Terpene synthase family, metal binding domain [Streptomyces aidingensis]
MNTTPVHQAPHTDRTDPGPSTTPREFHLPELPRLLPVAYHPHAARIEILSNGWVRERLGACFADENRLLRFLRQRNGLYGALVAPAAEFDRARAIADFYQYVTVIDTLTGDRTALGASQHGARRVFTEIMAGFGPGPDTAGRTPFATAATDLWRRISRGLSPAQQERLRGSLLAFLRGCATEVPYLHEGRVPDLDTYMTVRTDSFGCAFLILLTEYAMAVDTGDCAEALKEAHRHAMRQLILVNDLISWRKEHALRDTMNAVRVLCDHRRLPLQEAVDRLCGMVGHHERAYVAARDAVLAGPLGDRADVRAYLSGLDHLIGGSQEFEYLTPRYFGDGYVWDGATSGWLSLTAPVTRFRDVPHHPEST